MLSSQIQVGSTITNGECAVRITLKHEAGWIGIYISFESGSMTGKDCLVPLEELTGYEPVAWEWTELPGAGIEHRYVWSADWRTLEHETRALVSV